MALTQEFTRKHEIGFITNSDCVENRGFKVGRPFKCSDLNNYQIIFRPNFLSLLAKSAFGDLYAEAEVKTLMKALREAGVGTFGVSEVFLKQVHGDLLKKCGTIELAPPRNSQ